jgi:hypothetical protein
MNSMNNSMKMNNATGMMGGRRKTRKGSRKASRKSTRKNNAVVGGAMKAIGTRAEVMHGTAHHTSGGLTAKDLKYNKHGRIVSRKASEAGKKALKHLERAGFKARKGHFKLFTKKAKKGSRRH